MWFTVQSGRVPGLLTAGGGPMFSEYTRVALAPAVSVRVIDTENVPPDVGVPEITPAVESDMPAGRPFCDQLYGVVPPAPAMVAGPYETVTSPSGSDSVEIDGGPLIVIEYVLVVTNPVSSVSVIVIDENVPVALGLPVITPLGFIVRPVGNPTADHVNGEMPPEAVTWVPG